jgi:hypothetical protein
MEIRLVGFQCQDAMAKTSNVCLSVESNCGYTVYSLATTKTELLGQAHNSLGTKKVTEGQVTLWCRLAASNFRASKFDIDPSKLPGQILTRQCCTLSLLYRMESVGPVLGVEKRAFFFFSRFHYWAVFELVWHLFNQCYRHRLPDFGCTVWTSLH